MMRNEYQELLDTLLRKRMELHRRTQPILTDNGRPRSPDFAEQAVELEDSQVLDELAREAIEELGKINMALARHDAGHYGDCVCCGREISFQRLRAVPWAAYCISCANSNTQRRLD